MTECPMGGNHEEREYGSPKARVGAGFLTLNTPTERYEFEICRKCDCLYMRYHTANNADAKPSPE